MRVRFEDTNVLTFIPETKAEEIAIRLFLDTNTEEPTPSSRLIPRDSFVVEEYEEIF